jgi:uncharacterized RDD family membrane protein YckC
MAASPQAISTSIETRTYAALGRRLAAYLIDVVTFGSISFGVVGVLLLLRNLSLWSLSYHGIPPDALWRALGLGAKLAILLAYVLSLGSLYFTTFESSPWQATIGKRILGMYVTDEKGNRITPYRAFGRWLAKWIAGLFLLSVVSLFTIVATKKKRAVHDYMAATVVCRGTPATSGPIEPWRIVVAFGVPFLWLLGTFLATL